MFAHGDIRAVDGFDCFGCQHVQPTDAVYLAVVEQRDTITVLAGEIQVVQRHDHGDIPRSDLPRGQIHHVIVLLL